MHNLLSLLPECNPYSLPSNCVFVFNLISRLEQFVHCEHVLEDRHSIYNCIMSYLLPYPELYKSCLCLHILRIMQGLVIAVRVSGIKLKVHSLLGAYLVSLERERKSYVDPYRVDSNNSSNSSFLREFCSKNSSYIASAKRCNHVLSV